MKFLFLKYLQTGGGVPQILPPLCIAEPPKIAPGGSWEKTIRLFRAKGTNQKSPRSGELQDGEGTA